MVRSQKDDSLMRPGIAFLAILCVATGSMASPPDNAALSQVLVNDQKDRAAGAAKIDGKEVAQRDTQRRNLVLGELKDGDVRSANDYYASALVLQHGGSAAEIRLANALATIAAAIDRNNVEARRLKAATWDRSMMRLGRKQWYGTQFVRSKDTRRIELYPVELDAVSDLERKEMGVPALSEALRKVERMNGIKL